MSRLGFSLQRLVKAVEFPLEVAMILPVREVEDVVPTHLEGKEHVMWEGDVIHFHFNV